MAIEKLYEDDKEFYEDVINSFKSLNFTDGEQDAIWRQLSAILWLGNVKKDESRVGDTRRRTDQ